MKYAPLIITLFFAPQTLATGPTLDQATNVLVTEVGTDSKDPMAKYCENFKLSAAEALSFLNKAAIATRREIHDYYDVLPCFVRGTAEFHGYPATWEIRAGGTGSITLISGEYLPIADKAERYEPE